jgi:hypothetical protein
MRKVDAIIAALGGPKDVAEIIGTTSVHVRTMRQRGSVHIRHWPALIRAAEDRGVEGLTYETLVTAHTKSRAG